MDKEAAWSPPYNVPFATFLSTLDKVGAELPNKVDRSYLASQSGAVQTYLIAAYRGFALLKEDGSLTDELVELATMPERRPELIGDLLGVYYENATKLGQTNATPGELEQVFATDYPRLTGESRTKAIRFFLSALEYSGLPKSKLWKASKATGTRKRSGQRPPRTRTGNGGDGADTSGQSPKPKDMKAQYFELLLKKAEASDAPDEDLLNRIERLLGVEDAPEGSG